MVDISAVRQMLGNDRLIVLPFHRTHLERMEISDDDNRSLDALEDRALAVQGMEDSPYAWTVFHQLKPIAAFGVEVKWTGVAEAWMLTGEGARKNPIILTRAARRFFERIGPALNLQRLQIVVSVERSYALQWARFLNFEEEGRMKRYGPEGCDYLMFARTY